MTRSQAALMVALGVDSFGSGLFVPLALVYATRIVGLPLGVAGTVIAAGTTVGLLVPPIAGPWVDRVGPRAVVVTAQVIQAGGAAGYLLAHGPVSTAVAAVLLAAGQRLFFCALFALIADVAGDGPTDTAFARVNMVTSACFGLGPLAAGGLLTWAGALGYRLAIAADGVSFLVCSLVLLVAVAPPPVRRATARGEDGAGQGPLRDPIYLAYVGFVMLCLVTGEFFLVGMPVYILEQLHGPTSLPGFLLAQHTILLSIAGTGTVRLTRRFARTSTMTAGAALFVVWSLAGLAVVLLPDGWRPAWLIGTTLILSAASLLLMSRAGALADALAPRAQRGRYLATFEYSFAIAHILAPATVGLFAGGIWLPWAVVTATAALSTIGLRWIAPRIPAHANASLAERELAAHA